MDLKLNLVNDLDLHLVNNFNLFSKLCLIVTGRGYRGLIGAFLLLRNFMCCYFFASAGLFYLSFNSDFYVSKIMHLGARNLPCKPNNKVSDKPRQN